MVANNQGISHLARRAGAQPLCRNRKAHMSVAIDRFRADPGTMRVCTRCAAALAKLDELDSKCAIAALERPGGCGAARIQAGTISHGTLRSEDLIEAFASELACLAPSEFEGARQLLAEAQRYLDGCPVSEDEASELVNDLMDALNEFAPEGMYFGAHEGDGADFGFWHVDGEEDDREMDESIHQLERPGGCGAFRRTGEFEHYPGCRGDVANCSACALTDERQDAPNYAAWPLVYLEHGRVIPAKWRVTFERELASENVAYAANIRAAIARYGIRWSDEG